MVIYNIISTDAAWHTVINSQKQEGMYELPRRRLSRYYEIGTIETFEMMLYAVTKYLFPSLRCI